MPKDESATADQVRAQEKREAGQARAAAAAEASRKQVEAGESTVGDPSTERSQPPKGRKASSKTEA